MDLSIFMQRDGRPADVLLLDDEPRVAAALMFAIEGSGFKLRTVIEPGAFWAELTRGLPDLVLLDVDLKQSSGLTVLRKLRSRPDTAAVPVFILSGLIDPRVRTSALSAGADEYLIKPFNPDDLVKRMRRWLAVRFRGAGRM
jgi:DNA-binding response OmpR family regulator